MYRSRGLSRLGRLPARLVWLFLLVIDNAPIVSIAGSRGLLRELQFIASAFPPCMQVADNLLMMLRGGVRRVTPDTTLRAPPIGLTVRRPRRTHVCSTPLKVRALLVRISRLERRDARGAASQHSIVRGQALRDGEHASALLTPLCSLFLHGRRWTTSPKAVRHSPSALCLLLVVITRQLAGVRAAETIRQYAHSAQRLLFAIFAVYAVKQIQRRTFMAATALASALAT